MIVCALMAAISSTAAGSFVYYHAVSVAGLSAGAASMMTLVGGGIGLFGFPIGAWTAERFGRVPTAVSFGIFITAGPFWVYLGRPEALPCPPPVPPPRLFPFPPSHHPTHPP